MAFICKILVQTSCPEIFTMFLIIFLFEDHSWLKNLDQTNESVFDSDLKGLSKLRKAYPNNPIIGYLNINSLKEKIICLRDIISTSKMVYFICISPLSKALKCYDNIALAGDLNIDLLDPSKDTSNHLCDQLDVFNFKNLVK